MKEPQWAGGQHEGAWYVSNCNPEDRVAEQQRNIWRNKVLNFFFSDFVKTMNSQILETYQNPSTISIKKTHQGTV